MESQRRPPTLEFPGSGNAPDAAASPRPGLPGGGLRSLVRLSRRPLLRAALVAGWSAVWAAGAAAAGEVPPAAGRVRTALWQDLATLGRDAGAFATTPAGWEARHWTLLGATVAAVGAVTAADEGLRSTWRSGRSGWTRELAGLVRGGGELLGWGGVGAAATYVAGLALDRPQLHALGRDLVETALLSTGATAALKWAVGRARPDQEHGASRYRPLRGQLGDHWSSLPSQHTALAFGLATAAAANVPRLGWITYPLAGLVAWSRVHDDVHWTSDVLAGAAVGTATGLWVGGRGKERDGRVGVRVAVHGGAPLLVWRRTF